MIRNQKICIIAFVAIAVMFAGAISPITTAFAETVNTDYLQNHSDMTYEGKDGKSCPGKYKSSASA